MALILSLGACFGSDDATKNAVEDPPLDIPIDDDDDQDDDQDDDSDDDDSDDDDESDDDETPEVSTSYEDKTDEADAFADAIVLGDADGSLIDYASLPGSGSADYAGIMNLPDPTHDATGDIVGRFDLGINFSNADISGNADNFSNDADEVFDGNLDITGNFGSGVYASGTLTSESDVGTFFAAQATGIEFYTDVVGSGLFPLYVEGDLQGLSVTEGDTSYFSDEDGFGFIGAKTN